VKYGNVQSKRTWKVVQCAANIPVKYWEEPFRRIRLHRAGLTSFEEADNLHSKRLMNCSLILSSTYLEFLLKYENLSLNLLSSV
jgi:hypothetical protein